MKKLFSLLFAVTGLAFLLFSCATPKFHLDVVSSNDVYGTVSGSGDYEEGTAVELIATANDGYEFVGWYEGESLLSDSSNYSYAMPNTASSLEGKFAIATVATYQVSITLDNATGSATGAGNYQIGQAVVLTATPNEGYTFEGWYANNQLLSNSNPYLFQMGNADFNVEARFTAALPDTYILSLSSNDDSLGTFTGSGTFESGVNVTVSATANDGYEFVGWYSNGSQVTNDNPYTFVMPANNVELIARFAVYGSLHFTIDLLTDSTMGSVTGNGEYLQDETITISATAKEGCSFVKWVDANNNTVSTESEFEHSVVGSATFTAIFEVNTHILTLEIDSNKGDIQGATSGDLVAYNSLITLVVTPNSEYDFLGWYNGDTRVSQSLSYTFNMPDFDLTLEARFSYSVEITLVSGNLINHDFGTVTALIGNTIDFPYTEYEDYAVVAWYLDANLTNLWEYNQVVSEAVTLYAKWALKTDLSVYEEDFEDYTSVSNYQNEEEIFGDWKVMFGGPTNSSPRVDSKGLQTRYYSVFSNTFGYALTNFTSADLRKITFSAVAQTGHLITVSYSEDGEAFVGAKTFDITNIPASYTYYLNGIGKNVYIKFTHTLPYGSAGINGSAVTIDNVKFYQYNTLDTHQKIKDYLALSFNANESATNLRTSINIPTLPSNPLVTVTWSSNNLEYLSNEGAVINTDSSSRGVSYKATITYYGVDEEFDYDLIVTGKVAVSYSINNTVVELLNVYLGDYLVEPTTPILADSGYVFDYWYVSNQNTPFDFNTPITEAIALKAKTSAAVLDHIELISAPTKTSYIVGDTSINLSGLLVEAVYQENVRLDVTSSVIPSGFDTTTPNNQVTITITYQGKTLTFNISVTLPRVTYLENFDNVPNNTPTSYTSRNWESHGISFSATKVNTNSTLVGAAITFGNEGATDKSLNFTVYDGISSLSFYARAFGNDDAIDILIYINDTLVDTISVKTLKIYTANIGTYTDTVNVSIRIGAGSRVTMDNLAWENYKTSYFEYTYQYQTLPATGPVITSSAASGTHSEIETILLDVVDTHNYVFTGWYDGDTLLHSEPNYSFVLSKDIVITAKFDVVYYLTVDVTTGGSIQDGYSGGEFAEFETVSLTAIPDIGYNFLGWYNGVSKVSNSLTYLYTQDLGDYTLTAKFQIIQYTIEFENEVGLEIPDVLVDYDSVAALPTPSKTGYTFNGFYTNSDYDILYDDTLVVTTDLTLYAKFTINTHTLTLITGVNGTTNIKLNGVDQSNPAIFDYGTTVVITATPDAGYSFAHWLENSVENESLAASAIITLTSDRTLEAVFHEKLATEKVITFSTDPITVGSITTDPSILSGSVLVVNDIVTLSAPSNPSYTFVGWYDGSMELTTNIEYVLTVTDDITLTAKYNINSYNINLSSEDVLMGTVSASGSANALSEFTAIATPEAGYAFEGWYNGGTKVSSDATYKFIPTGDTTLVAKFIIASRIVTFVTNLNDTTLPNVALSLGDLIVEPVITNDYILIGWFTDSNFEYPWDFSIDTIVDSMTLYAKWDFKTILAVILEDFESSSSSLAYADTTLTTDIGTYDILDTYMQANSTQINGSYGLRIREGYIGTTTAISGIESISFIIRTTSASHMNNSALSLQVSLDKSNWKTVLTNIKTDSANTAKTIQYTIDYTNQTLIDAGITPYSSLYVRIENVHNGSFIILDDIVINSIEHARNEFENSLIPVLNGADTSNSIKHNITLPSATTVAFVSDITWVSSNSSLIDNTGAIVGSTTSSTTVTLTLSYKENGIAITPIDHVFTLVGKVAVTYDIEGDLSNTENVFIGDMLANIPVVNKNGFRFVGWLLNGDPFNVESPITSTITLVADFKELFALTVSAETGGLLVDTYDGQYIAGEVIELEASVNSGYQFLGWYDDSDLLSTNLIYEYTTISSIVNITAKFAKLFLLDISADSNGTIDESVDNYYIASHELNLTVTATPNAGYIFSGWQINDAPTLDATNPYVLASMPTNDLVLVAKFEKASYVITIDQGVNGTITVKANNINVNSGDSHLYQTELVLSGVGNSGFIITGFTVNDIQLTGNNHTFTLGENCLIKGIFEAGYVVTYSTNSKYPFSFPVPPVDYVLAGAMIEKMPSLTSLNYEIIGWFKDYLCTTLWDFEMDTVTSNITLYAKYEIVDLDLFRDDYQIIYSAGQNADGVKSAITLNTDALENFAKIEWSSSVPTVIANDGTVVAPAIGDPNTPVVMTVSIIYYEGTPTTWMTFNLVHLGKSSVTFDTLGGSLVTQLEVYNGETIVKPEEPTLAGHMFMGWFIGEDEFNFESPVTENITLTAKWLAEGTVIPTSIVVITLVENVVQGGTLVFTDEDTDIEVTYSDGSTDEDLLLIADVNIGVIDTSNLGTKTIIFSYTENGVTVTTNIEIEVVSNALSLSLTVSSLGLTGSGYAGNNGDHTVEGFVFTTNQAMLGNSVIQMQKNTGSIYNKTSLGKIISIQIITASGGTLTVKGGTSQQPSTTISGNGGVYDFSNNDYNYFIIGQPSAAAYVSEIIITYAN